MAVSVSTAGTGAQATPSASSQPPAAWESLQVPVTCNPGDWLLAVVTWRQQAASEGATVHVGDDTIRNYWQPLGQPTGTSGAAGVTRTAIWAAPAVTVPQYVLVAPTATVQGIACVVLGVTGMAPWESLAGGGTTFGNAVTSLGAIAVGTPASQAIMVTGCGGDNTSATIGGPGAGWTGGGFVSASNGVDHTADITLNAAYQLSSASVSATWTATASTDLSAAIFGVLVAATAPSQASAYWPVTVAELAVGAGPNTPEDQRTWTAVTAQSLAINGVVQGAQYNLTSLVAGQGTVTFDNPAGNLTPPGSGSFAGIDSGTPFRVRQTWAGGAWQVQFHGNGSTNFPNIFTGFIPVTAGLTYTTSAWLNAQTLWASGMYVQFDWQNGGGHISFTAGTIVTAGAVAQLASVTGTAPAGATGVLIGIVANLTPPAGTVFQAAAAPVQGLPGYLPVPSAVSWNSGNAATITTLAPFTPDPRGPAVATPYGVPFGGAVRAWPQEWDPALLRGVTKATLADAWAYCNGNPQPILIQEILNDQPYAYWPCTDPAGSAQASNLAAGNSNPLVVTQSKYGTGATVQSFGQNSQALLGAQGTYLITSSVRVQTQAGMWSVTGLPSGAQQGSCLFAQDPAFPRLSAGVTLECWFQLVSPFPAGLAPQPIFLIGHPANDIFFINADPATGHLFLQGSTFGPFNVGTAGVNYDTASVLTHFAITCTNTAYTVYINGVQTASGSFGVTLAPTFQYLAVNGAFTPSLELVGVNGFTGHIAVFAGQLTETRIRTHYLAGAVAMQGDSPDARIERLLQAAPYTGRRVILQDSGSNVTPCASCQDIGGQSAAASIQNIASSTVPAVLGISPPGELFYLARGYVYDQPVRWTLGEDTSLGEIPYLDDVGFGWDPLRVVNDVQLTQLDNQDVVTPSAPVETIDLASQQQYGDQPYWATGYLENDLLSGYAAGPGLVDLANWIGAVNAKPGLRLAQVTVDAARNPAAWPLFMQAARGDMIQVNRRPVTAPGVVLAVTGRISQTTRNLQWSQDGCAGTISLLVDVAAEQNVLTADDAVRGQLTGANVLAW